MLVGTVGKLAMLALGPKKQQSIEKFKDVYYISIIFKVKRDIFMLGSKIRPLLTVTIHLCEEYLNTYTVPCYKYFFFTTCGP